MKRCSTLACAVALVGSGLLAGCEPAQKPIPTGPPAPTAPTGPPSGGTATAPRIPPVGEAVKRIKDALAPQQQRLQIQDLKLEVRGGVIHMTGKVKTEYLKNQAGNVAGPSSGGAPFSNDLTVVESP